jgi:VIT1/CCC1 family predicted Fe2+/Mn2+ transporter
MDDAPLRAFIQRHLDPADRLGEILFGLIMALGFTGAVRLGFEEADNRALFIGIFGCNLAWAIVDGVMYVIGALFERGRKARLAQEVANAPTEEAALHQIGEELDGPLMALTTPGERGQIHRWVLEILRREKMEPARLHREDLLGGVAVALIIMLATLPVVVPYLVVPNPDLAVGISHLIALTLLFLLGLWWGRVVGSSPFRLAGGLTLVGMVLVLITILLGG